MTYCADRHNKLIDMLKDMPLIEKIEAHLEASKTSPTKFGVNSLGDPNLVFELREGRWLRGPTRQRVVEYIEQAEAGQGTAA